ncbi:MAG TPA: nickel pincer cofactor biosynthesis protein LarB [Actinomycetota bacterium]|nr:nickel pincer cofactor biosynthesis protein LarB [Actinomycetota bacterium]
MDEASIRLLFEKVRSGETSIDDATASLAGLPFSDLGYAMLDHHRELRTGLAESVYGPGKTPDQVAGIAQDLHAQRGGAVLVTHASVEQFRATRERVPECTFDELTGMLVVRRSGAEPAGVVVVASAGTSDQKVARECLITLDALAIKGEAIEDVGVAGIHRLFASSEALDRADVVIAIAGMEGALASIIGGLVSVPVIAVPTSVGYGAGAGGIAALLTMINSCAPGVAVVNIDNGYGAAVFAATILRARS